jgi:hypothetical protein
MKPLVFLARISCLCKGKKKKKKKERKKKCHSTNLSTKHEYYHPPVNKFQVHFPLGHLPLHSVALSILSLIPELTQSIHRLSARGATSAPLSPLFFFFLFSFPAPLEVFQLPPRQREWEVHLLAFFYHFAMAVAMMTDAMALATLGSSMI